MLKSAEPNKIFPLRNDFSWSAVSRHNNTIFFFPLLFLSPINKTQFKWEKFQSERVVTECKIYHLKLNHLFLSFSKK